MYASNSAAVQAAGGRYPWERAAAQRRAERLSVEQFHHGVPDAALLAHRVHRDEVGVVEHARRVGLAPEPLQPPLAGVVALVQQQAAQFLFRQVFRSLRDRHGRDYTAPAPAFFETQMLYNEFA